MNGSEARKTCFVIMPYGEKLNMDERLMGAVRDSLEHGTPLPEALKETIPFDTIHRTIIEEAARALGLECIRCDEIAGAGSMHEDMFRHILEADVAIVDISGLSANVFYELGIRHTLRKKVTVLIQREGTVPPFNIQGYRVISYDERDPDKAFRAKSEIVDFVRAGLERRQQDSPVYKHLPELRVTAAASGRARSIIPETRRYDYSVAGADGVSLGLVTGSLDQVRGIDVWVNSENRNMQMARYHDQSISGAIRWLGARKVQYTDEVLEDTIALALAEVMNGKSEVQAGVVIPTTSGQLQESHGVKRVFHAAVVEGRAGKGYRLVPGAEACVTRALELLGEFEEEGLESILFPLIGTGGGGAAIEQVLNGMVTSSLRHVRSDTGTAVKSIHILIPHAEALEVGLALLDGVDGLARI